MLEQDKRGAAEEAPAPGPKKPYVRPTLRRLGTVRDLTLGGGASPHTDGLRSTRPKGM